MYGLQPHLQGKYPSGHNVRSVLGDVTDNPSVWCGSFWPIPRSSMKRNAFIFVTDKSSLRCGSFWPIPCSSDETEQRVFMYRVLFSCPHSAAYSVLARSILRLSWHTWPTVVSTRCYSIFKKHSGLLRNCGGSNLISFHLYTVSKPLDLSRDFKFFWKFWNVPLIGRQQKEGKDNRIEKVPSIGSQWKRHKYNPFR